MKLEEQYRVNQIQPFVPVLKYINTVYSTFIISVCSILIFSSHLLPFQTICFLQISPNKTVSIFLFLPMRATRPTHFILFDLIPRLDLLRILNHGAPHYVIFYTFLLFYPFRTRHLPQRLTLQPGSSLSIRDQISHTHTE